VPDRLLWCLHADCLEPFLSRQNYQPPVCPACNRPKLWATLPPRGARPHPGAPKEPFTLTRDDRLFLKSYGIRADREDLAPKAVDEDDGA
jgi:hypothetical protein